MKSSAKSLMNPYVAGVCLGGVLLLSFLILGTGLGASSGVARIGAAIEARLLPVHTANSPYFGAWGKHPLDYYLVYMFAGTMIGGLISAVWAKRLSVQLEKGGRCSPGKRISFALAGGVLVGYASRLAMGCTSGQALTGGSLLLTGSCIFLVCLFAGGYAAAYFVRRQWDD